MKMEQVEVMEGDSMARVRELAPVLRAALRRRHAITGIRFEAQRPEGETARLELAGEGAAALAGAAQELAARLPVGCAAVEAPGLGWFALERTAATGGRAAGKVALVTGAGQGVGFEVARALAAEGACVVLADLNEAAARAAAAGLNEQHGAGRALGLAMDVTSGESTRAALGAVVSRHGGLDLLVSNAGVLKAGSVMTQPEADFEFVTAVNYKGFFNCVQAAAPVMAAQRRGDGAAWSDIIQINSKSGLVGSNRNGAYAGSKFGGIGLVQSFAMELVESGIKVNAICPGNFFDLPLWSNPENGLFVQYLRTGKVPGARTIEDVRRGYEEKIPMGRGCMIADLMRALFYLVEQEYETGQALPVTGGQVMLH